MKRYANLSDRSGVALYDYDEEGYSYITVQFKDGSVYSYTIAGNSLNTIMDMIGRGNIGVGLNRYIDKYQPVYIKGEVGRIDIPDVSTNVNEVKYPKHNIQSIEWNNGHDWLKITKRDGSVSTYTVDSCGIRALKNLIKYSKLGYGLWEYIRDNKPLSVEEIAQNE